MSTSVLCVLSDLGTWKTLHPGFRSASQNRSSERLPSSAPRSGNEELRPARNHPASDRDRALSELIAREREELMVSGKPAARVSGGNDHEVNAVDCRDEKRPFHAFQITCRVTCRYTQLKASTEMH